MPTDQRQSNQTSTAIRLKRPIHIDAEFGQWHKWNHHASLKLIFQALRQLFSGGNFSTATPAITTEAVREGWRQISSLHMTAVIP